MKYRSFVAFVFVLLCLSARAQTPREELLEKVEAEYLSAMVFAPDSPLLKNLLAPAAKVNAAVAPDEWARVSNEASQAVTRMFTAKNGPLDMAFRASLQDLSDDELAHLDRLLGDPVYQKFQHAASTPESQRRMLQAVLANSMNMHAAVNAVLARHGLNQVH